MDAVFLIALIVLKGIVAVSALAMAITVARKAQVAQRVDDSDGAHP